MNLALLRLALAMLGAGLAPGATAQPAEPPLQICFDERDQSAFLHRDADGAWRGAALELVQRAWAQAGLRVRLQALPWGRCLREVAEFGGRGRIEALFYASRNPARERHYLFSAPLHQIRGGAWYSRRQYPLAPPRLQTLQGLGAYRLCGMAHHNYDWLQLQGVAGIDQGAPSLQSALSKLAMGRCELVLSSWEAVRGGEQLGQLNADADRAFLPYPGREPVDQHLLFARGSERSQRLLQRFDQALRQLRADGSADEIYRRHLGAAAMKPP